MRVYIIAPAADFGGQGRNELTADDTIGANPAFAVTASLAIATIAAFFPTDSDLRLCDELLEPVDYTHPADLVAISVNVAQAKRGVAIARQFRSLGKTVVMGGPHVSLAPELFDGEADTLVIGEFESVAMEFLADLMAGNLKPVYRGAKADMAKTPMPRWDLYPNDRTISGVVQTSRGCPFNCNFCDVIQYLGRVQRHKPIDRVLAEVQSLYDHGYRQISLSDDNFTVYRQRTQALLQALAEWNGQEGREPVSFATQASIDLARSPALVARCNQAGLRNAFIGIETSNEDALKESGKRQNTRRDLVAECEAIVGGGISIQAGLMVGFDSDGLDCFERQFDFMMSLPVISFRIAVLVAPVATALYAEMKAAGRIVDDPALVLDAGAGSMTNIVPLQMTREELSEGAIWLRNALLAPQNIIKRFENYAMYLKPAPEHLRHIPPKATQAQSRPMKQQLAALSSDKEVRQVIECVRDLRRRHPEIRLDLMEALAIYLNRYAWMVNIDRTVRTRTARAEQQKDAGTPAAAISL